MNILSLVVGVLAVVMILLIPLWLSKLIRNRRYNLAAGYGLDKRTAVLLAVFLSFWAWLYTKEKDMSTFWINLILSILSGGYWSIIAWLWVVITMAVRPPEFYRNYQTMGKAPTPPAAGPASAAPIPPTAY